MSRDATNAATDAAKPKGEQGDMNELDVFRLLLARRDNYGVRDLAPVRGRLYTLTMQGRPYRAVVLPRSFDFYRLRYHLITHNAPDLVVCAVHDTVLPIAVLSLRAGNYAAAYELPEEITDVGAQRYSQTGAQVLLGMYLCGVRYAQSLIKELPTSTRNRYLAKARALGGRTRGRPVGS